MTSTDTNTGLNQELTNFPNIPVRLIQVDGVDEPHKFQFVLIYRIRFTVNRRAVNRLCLALLDQSKSMFTVDHIFALSNPALTSALSKKSFSKVSLPILAFIFSIGFYPPFRQKPGGYAKAVELSWLLPDQDELQTSLQSYCRSAVRQRPSEP
jgi:hypothetical protein